MTYIQRLVTQRDMTKYLKNEIKLKKHVTFNLLDVVSNLQVLAIRADAMYLFFLIIIAMHSLFHLQFA